MAATFWRGDDEKLTGSWWVKTYHPVKKKPVRKSAETVDKARAELICERLELELKVQNFSRRGIFLPQNLITAMDLDSPVGANGSFPGTPTITAPAAPASPPIGEVLGEFLAFIEVENSPAHAVNKIAYLKKFFGSELLGLGKDSKGVFRGETLAEVKVADVRKLIDSLPIGRKSKQHHRAAFHAMFEFAMKYNYFVPTNFRYPNPMSALPGYQEKNKKIVYLTSVQVDALMEILKPYPAVRICVALMIYAGLRRAEALWLTRDCISPDLRFFSVVNKIDEEKDLESRLKTGERPVPIVPALKAILEPYLATLEGQWLVPSPTGMQWDGDNFGAKHRSVLREHDLEWTCLIYRHTFATHEIEQSVEIARIFWERASTGPRGLSRGDLLSCPDWPGRLRRFNGAAGVIPRR